MKRLSLCIFLISSLYVEAKEHIKTKHLQPSKIITTHWVNQPEMFQSRGKHFRYKPLFESFDKDFFETHLLPQNAITYRNDISKTVHGSHLDSLINQALSQLRDGKKQLTHFTIIKELEFNRSKLAGCMVLKFNDYPFVLKLFIETPQSFHRPRDKGFRHGQLSHISGGINRYLAGFGRIKNLEATQQYIIQNPQLSANIDFPRKWFWQPQKNKWFVLNGKGFGPQEFSVKLPEVYGIVTDEIVTTAPLHYVRKHYGRHIFKFCKSLKFNIDPNMKNFRLEQGTNKLVLIDTEHFPTLLGLTEELQVDNYFSLHLFIGFKVIKDHVKTPKIS